MTSLPNDFKANYDGELADFWQAVINACHQGSRVLDVCTGNGAVAILLKEMAQQAQLDISMTAVDASQINPQAVLKQFPDKQQVIDDINFISGCLVEQLIEHVDDSFDLIVSQYGIEYCDTEAAAHSVASVLKPGGRLVFVSHDSDTAILRYMQEEEQVYQLFDELKGWDMLQQFGIDQLSVNGFKNRLNDFLTALKQHVTMQHMPLVNQWGQAMVQLLSMSNQSLKQQRQAVMKFYQQYRYSRARSQDMLAVADKLSQDPQWFRAFVRHGLVLEEQGVIKYRGQHIAGHSYAFRKPA